MAGAGKGLGVSFSFLVCAMCGWEALGSHGYKVCAMHCLPVEAEPRSRVSSLSMKHKMGMPREVGPVRRSKVKSI